MKLVTDGLRQTKNKEKFFKKSGIFPRQLVIPIQSHSNRVALIDDGQLAKPIPSTDGLVTKLPNVFLTMSVADCFPVYFF